MSHARYIVGDSLTVLRALPDASVDLVLTSPPFLALRSYLPSDHPDKALEMGSEPTPGAFIDALLTLTEELRRVLAPHGSLCVELGDTYGGSGGAGGDYNPDGLRAGQEKFDGSARRGAGRAGGLNGLASIPGRKHYTVERGGDGWPLDKSLCLIPELLRFALAYGFNPLTGRTTPPWRVRNVIRWCRPNPPVGALGDKFRPGTSEMVVACVGRKRYFDLDAVRGPSSPNTPARTARGVESVARAGKSADRGGNWASLPEQHDTAGAPPLDWWAIPTEPYVTPDGLLVVPAGGTAHRVRVPVGVPGDGIQRTASPSCPVHVSPDRPGSSAPDGGRGDSASSHTGHSGAHPSPAPRAGSLPIPATPEPVDATTATPRPEREAAATPHDTGSNRTALALATGPVGTPSARTNPRTDGTPASPESSALRLDMDGSSSAAACPPAVEPGTEPRSAHTSEPSSACTCSYWIEMDVASETTSDYAGWPGDSWEIPTEPFRGSHYATWPSDLLVRPIKTMCPPQVCRTCGVPSERVVRLDGYTDHNGKLHPTAEKWSSGVTNGAGAHSNKPGRRTRTTTTTGWTDCGHGDYRPGLVLDPFAGSGTTLAVATGHGRDAIGIDLDARNADLAAQRVGMFLTVEQAPAEVEA